MSVASHTSAVDLGRGSRTTVYIEPEMYELLMKLAVAEGKSYSTLVRGVLLRHLIQGNSVPADFLMKLAGG